MPAHTVGRGVDVWLDGRYQTENLSLQPPKPLKVSMPEKRLVGSFLRRYPEVRSRPPPTPTPPTHLLPKRALGTAASACMLHGAAGACMLHGAAAAAHAKGIPCMAVRPLLPCG